MYIQSSVYNAQLKHMLRRHRYRHDESDPLLNWVCFSFLSVCLWYRVEPKKNPPFVVILTSYDATRYGDIIY